MKRIIFISAAVAAAGVYLMYRIMKININSDHYLSFDMSAPRQVTVVCSYGDIYDRNGDPIVNRESTYIAVIDPENVDTAALDGHIIDREKYDACISGTALFLCETDCADINGVTVIEVKKRVSENTPAPHIIGYTDENGGVCGIELACNDLLRQPASAVTLRYSVDANGNMLEGDGLTLTYDNSYYTGVCTSIDLPIQLAAENAMKDVDKGAAIVIDISTGEICACVSCPAFDPSCPELSLDDSDSPFINRAFCAYSVGSAFKLVTAGAALEYGISPEYSYDCSGEININGVDFSCHRYGGHGRLDMRLAMIESCNPYFIALGRDIPTTLLHDFAQTLCFGKPTRLADGIHSAAGYLPDVNELSVPAEKANFCFGQGKISATPLQVALMTAAIANEGQMPAPILINGGTRQGESAAVAASPFFTRVMSRSTAQTLKEFMISTLYKENSAAVPEFTTGGGKTSTAQTWQYDENGSERMNCWFTGFFPADNPRYAVTVMIEDGVSGNLTCGPVFREIADSVKMKRYAKKD